MKAKDRHRLLERAVQAQAARADVETPAGGLQLGDVVSLASTAELAVLWAWIETESDGLGGERAVLVAADLYPWVGSADVFTPSEASCGALSLRCAIEVGVALEDLQGGTPAGRLPISTLRSARLKRVQWSDGTLKGSWGEQNTDADPEYQAWMNEGPRRAQTILRMADDGEPMPVTTDACDAVSGRPWGYSFEAEDIVDRSLRETVDPGLLQLLQHVHRSVSQPHLGAGVGAADHDPAHWGWGLVVGSDEPSEILIALQPLIDHRRRQLGDDQVKILDHRPEEDWRTWLARHGVAPGQRDATQVPYYLLIVGPPQRISFEFQQILGVEYAVGRLSFGAAEDLAAYARDLVSRELAEPPSSRRAVYFAPSTTATDDGLDLDELTTRADWQVQRLEGQDARPERLLAALKDTEAPPVHMVAAVTRGWIGTQGEDRRKVQGALIGHRDATESLESAHRIAASDAETLRVTGSVLVLLAAHSAATPADEPGTDGEGSGGTAVGPFVAALPRRLLARGAHAVVGRVGPGWHPDGVPADPGLADFIGNLAQGLPVGHALQRVRTHYASLATELATKLEKVHMGGRHDASDLAALWAQRNNLRDLILLGDPAVHIPKPEAVSTSPSPSSEAGAPGLDAPMAEGADALPSDVTVLLERWSNGDAEALSQLMPLVFDDLRAMAHNFFRKEAPNQTLQTTALVHEVYLRLQGRRTVQWRNQSHFFGSLAKMIRRILVDRARRRKSAKRGGGVPPLRLDELLLTVEARDPDLLALDEALESLEKLSPRQHKVVELKFFMGLTLEEIAEVLGVAKSTVIKDWANARAFLLRELSRGVGRDGSGEGEMSGHE